MIETPVIKAVIFDMGGVILRTMDMRPRRELARRYGVTLAELDQIVFHNRAAQAAEHGQATTGDIWREVGRLLNAPAPALEGIAEQFFAGDSLDFTLVDYIRGLRPRYITALLSNTWKVDLACWLHDRWQLPTDTFDVVVSSARYAIAKPDPRIYQIALAQVHAAPGEAIFVDDFSQNIAAADALGIHTVPFRGASDAIAAIQQLLKRDEDEAL